jgi:glycerol-3-phosphate O-acyltransferase
MDTIHVDTSLYIRNSIVETDVNSLVGRIIGLFFRGINFDKESLQTLKEYQNKGRVVFASYQSANTTLMVLTNLLQQYGFKSPSLALDFTPNPMQAAVNFFESSSMFFQKITGRKKYETISDFNYILELLRSNKAMIISLLSRKLFIRRYIEIKSDTIQYLVEAQKLMEDPIYVFPQILFWNQNPEKTRMLVTSRATADRGFFSGLFTLMKSATPSFMRICPPLNLKEEIAQSPADDPRQIARKVRNKLLEIYNNEKRITLGPTIKSQQEMMEKVLYHKNVLDEISMLMEKEHLSENKLRKKAYEYFREIAANFSIITIKWFNQSVQYMFTKIFDGIYFNTDELKRVREAALKAPIIFVPSHKSHMDYLIISSMLYMNKIIPPHIVAGANLTFFPMGPIFRKSGAFFMRRSFKGLYLYPTIFKQYIKTLISEGYSIEVFIEGTRTRTGKLISPKMGILSYLIEAINEGYGKDMIFIPTTISYDRILEESTYHMELKGKEKETESTSNFVKSRKFLKRKYGKVYLSFNEPFSFCEFRDSLKEGADLASSLGHYIMRRIGEIVMATPFSVASAAMLLSSAGGFTRDMVKHRIAVLHDFLAHVGVRMSDHLAKSSNFDEIIDYVIDSYSQDGIVGMPVAGAGEGMREVLDGVYTLNENERARINFYKNSILHFFLPITFVSVALLTRADDAGADGHVIANTYADLMDIFSEEFIYLETTLDAPASIRKTLDYLIGRSAVAVHEGKYRMQKERRDDIVLFAKAVQDFLESYLVVCDCLIQVKKRMNRKDLLYEVRKNGIKLFHLGEIKLAESLSVPNYETAIVRLSRMMAIEEVQAGKKQTDVQIRDVDRIIGMKNRIEMYLKPLQKM